MARDAMMVRLGRLVKHPIRTLVNRARNRHCWACGHDCLTYFTPIYTPELIEGHGFNAEWARYYDLREGEKCRDCGRSARSRQIARTLVSLYGNGQRSLSELCRDPAFRSLAIAEINQCASLHEWLVDHPGLRYSEYGSTDPEVPSEDTMDLSYADGSFDLVLTSDTLEHVPDLGRSLAEIRRVLRPGGRHVFTIPVIWDRQETKRRAIVEYGKIVHLLPPCYHGGSLNPEDCLAFYEYGSEVLDEVRAAGFEVNLFTAPKNPALRTIVSRRLD
jgi:SAM-dependent methyltransferase